MDYSANLIMGMLSTILTYFPNTESNTAGRVFSISKIRTGTPFLIDDFISCWNDEFVNLVTFLLSFDNLFNIHFVAWLWGSINKGHLLPSTANIAFYNDVVSEGSPSMIQSLITSGSPKVFIIWKSYDKGKSLAWIKVVQ